MDELKELKLVTMDESLYEAIISKSNDENLDCLYKAEEFYAIKQMYKTMFCDCDYTERTFAIIENRLYELPDDWKEIYRELKEKGIEKEEDNKGVER